MSSEPSRSADRVVDVEAKLQRWVQRAGWNRASWCYDRFWQRQLQPAVDLLCHVAALQPGERVIDVACGTGVVALAAAEAVGPSGRVLATDISSAMVAEVERSAERRGLDNVDVECTGAEQLHAHEEFDVALCSLGLMYVPDPLEAVTRLCRAVRPGGRAVVSVWGERKNCGWAEIFPIVDRRVNSDVCPMFFALGAPGALVSLLTAAGFVDAVETRLAVELPYAGPEDALGAAFDGGPVALAASRFDDADRASAAAEYLASIAEFSHGDGYRVPGEFVVGAVRKSPAAGLVVPLARCTTHEQGTPSRRDVKQPKQPTYPTERDIIMTITDSSTDIRPVDNGVNTEALLGARDALSAAPEAADFTWRATCSWIHGTYSRTTVDSFSGLGEEQRHRSTFEFHADHPECFASQDRGATPVEIVLAGLAACLTAGVAAVAQHRGIQLHSVTARLEGAMNVLGILGADPDTRNGFSGIEVTFDIDADASADDIAALVAQSQKRSAVFDIVTNPTDVHVRVG